MKESFFRIFRLLKVIIGTIDLDVSMSNKRNKKGKGFGSKLFLGLIFLFLIGEFGFMALFMSIGAYDALAPLGLQSLILSVTVAAGSLIVFVFGIFYVISVFYHTKDIERLLAMPFRPFEIVAAKFLSLVVFEYLTSIVFLIPLAVYGIKNGEGPVFYIYALLTLLLIPIIPLTLNAVIIMPVMRFVKLFRNKDAFTTISSILLMFLALGLNFYIQKAATSGIATEAMISKADKIAQLGTSVFPGSIFAAKALVYAGNIKGLLFILAFFVCSALAVGIVMLLAQWLYIPAASAVTSSYSKSKKLSSSEMDKQLSSSGSTRSYIKKEIAVLVRTPIFFLNNVIINFLWPIIIGMTFLYPSSEGSGQPLTEIIKGSIDYSSLKILIIILFVSFSAGIFTGGTNGIAATCLSREGLSFNLMKIWPISYFKQIMIKCTVGFIFSMIGIICTLAVFFFIAQPPVWILLLIFLASAPGVIFSNLFTVVFDLINPKLHWDNEQKAVKQNMNYMFAMFLSMGIAAGVVSGGILLPLEPVFKAVILVALAVLVNVIMLYVLKNLIPKKMEEHYY